MRDIERRQHDGVGEREGREQPAAAEHEPGLVAVPEGRDRVHHGVAVLVRGGEREQHAEAEIVAAEQHVENTASARIAAQTSGRITGKNSVIWLAAVPVMDSRRCHWTVRKVRLALFGSRRRRVGPSLHELGNVIDAGAEHDAVDEHEQNERGEHAAAGTGDTASAVRSTP